MSTDHGFLPLDDTFSTVRKGYNPDQVDEHLKRLDAEVRITAVDRDAAASQAADLASQLDTARVEIEALHARADRLAVLPSNTDGLSDRLQRMLRLAQDESSEIRARAESEAAEVRSVAEQEAASLREQLETMVRQSEQRRAEMEQEHTDTMTSARAEAEAVVASAETARDRADSVATRRRAQVSEDFELAMGARRSEALDALQKDGAASKAEAERRVRDATTEAQRRLQRANEQSEQRTAAASASVAAMTRLRQQVADQIAEVADLAATAPDLLAPLPAERAPVLPVAPGAAPAEIVAPTPDETTPDEPAPASSAEGSLDPAARPS